MRLLLLSTLFTWTPLQSDPLVTYKWNSRLLLIFSSGQETMDRKQQVALSRSSEELVARDMLVITIHGQTNHQHLLDTSEVAYLRAKYRIPEEGQHLLLIGKDGTVKLQKDTYVPPVDIFRLIDGMPMRRMEMKQRKG